jgi:pimeloyl-ACP methyl ester carboxylesterase
MKKRNIAIGIAGAAAVGAGIIIARRPKTVSWEDVASLVPHSERSNFVEVDGIRIHYQEFGPPDAPAMILVHGYTASVYVWHVVAPALAEKGFRVIAVDLVGFGYSEKPRTFDYTMASQAKMIAGFMDALRIERATLVGNSYGGGVVAMLALDNPDCVERLVLVDAVINDEAIAHPILRLAKYRGVGEVITPLLGSSQRFFRMRMRATFAKSQHPRLVTRDRIAAIRRPLHSKEGHHSVLATSRAWSAARIERDAHQIKCPTLILWGDSDNVIKIHNGYTLHREIPGSRFVIFRDCGHVPPEEKAGAFVEVVSNFCKNAEIRSTGNGR